MKTAVYRHFDKGGCLLYVGLTVNPLRRTQQHAALGARFEQVARIEIEWFDSRRDALIAERSAIAAELPLQNIAHGEKVPLPQEAPKKISDEFMRSLPLNPIREMVKQARLDIADLATVPEFGSLSAVCGALSNMGGGSVFTIIKLQNGNLNNPTAKTIDRLRAAIKTLKHQQAA